VYYGNEEDESEIKNINEITENVVNKNSSEIGGYYTDKTGKYCRNYNLIFRLENKLCWIEIPRTYQCLEPIKN
jgi:hypothetical protein